MRTSKRRPTAERPASRLSFYRAAPTGTTKGHGACNPTSAAPFVRRARGSERGPAGASLRAPLSQGPSRRGILTGMDAPEKRRWYCPTPGWLVLGSLAVTGLLFLSERWRWLPLVLG